MIGIRADANSIIATGHVMRCITIARAIKTLGEDVTFFVADDESLKLLGGSITENEFEVVVLGTDWQNMDSESETLINELMTRKVKTLLVDSYQVTRTYFDKLKDVCRIAYLDDLNCEAYPVNVLINYSGYSTHMGYDKAYQDVTGYNNEKTSLCLGLQYAPLRKQFYDPASEAETDADTISSFSSREFKHVLISTGGADMCSMLELLINMIIKSKLQNTAIWHIVVGDYVDDPDRIVSLIEGCSNIVIHRSVRNMAYLMNRCDIAVMAAGTMLTECAACGLPTIFYQVADNQKYNVVFWGASEGMFFAGDVSEGEANKMVVLDNIQSKIMNYLNDTESLKGMSDSLKSITDGRGAIRIARALMGQV